MKKNDIIFILLIVAIFAPFALIPELYDFFKSSNAQHPFLWGFIKFGLLATMGEALGLRIQKGVYNERGFGLLPRAFVWGLLGIWIVIAMIIFKAGAPIIAEKLGIEGVCASMSGDFSWQKLIGAFFISVTMNTAFAPVFMAVHKVTDTQIINNGGSLRGFFRPLPFGSYLAGLNWGMQWSFVYKKTIPFFWIPAHTITFLLPGDFQVLFAALLGIALGVLLSINAVKGKKQQASPKIENINK